MSKINKIIIGFGVVIAGFFVLLLLIVFTPYIYYEYKGYYPIDYEDAEVQVNVKTYARRPSNGISFYMKYDSPYHFTIRIQPNELCEIRLQQLEISNNGRVVYTTKDIKSCQIEGKPELFIFYITDVDLEYLNYMLTLQYAEYDNGSIQEKTMDFPLNMDHSKCFKSYYFFAK